jgi:hypothetical protein
MATNMKSDKTNAIFNFMAQGGKPPKSADACKQSFRFWRAGLFLGIGRQFFILVIWRRAFWVSRKTNGAAQQGIKCDAKFHG